MLGFIIGVIIGLILVFLAIKFGLWMEEDNK